MKTPWLTIAVLAASSVARADVFDIKDLPGYKKCLQLDELVETVHTPDGAQQRFLDQAEIQERCVAGGAKLLAAVKKKDLALQFVEATIRLGTRQGALDIVRVLVDISLPSCNEMSAYEVMLRPISDGFEEDEATPKARAIIKSCLKDKAFKKDFLEELDSGDKARARNACAILVEEKLIKSCKGGTP